MATADMKPAPEVEPGHASDLRRRYGPSQTPWIDAPGSPLTYLEKIDAVLASRGMRRASLARMIGCSESRISRWFTGMGLPNIHQGHAIANALGVSLDWLADESASYPPPEPPLMLGKFLEVLGVDEVIRRIMVAPSLAPAGVPAPEVEQAGDAGSPAKIAPGGRPRNAATSQGA